MSLTLLTTKSNTRRGQIVITDLQVIFLREAAMEDRDGFIKIRLGDFLISLPWIIGKPLQHRLNLGSNNNK